MQYWFHLCRNFCSDFRGRIWHGGRYHPTLVLLSCTHVKSWILGDRVILTLRTLSGRAARSRIHQSSGRRWNVRYLLCYECLVILTLASSIFFFTTYVGDFSTYYRPMFVRGFLVALCGKSHASSATCCSCP